MNNITLGIAGRKGHGRTSLIKALTGIDTERMAREKSKDLTLDLGFAYMELPSGIMCGIVDVPADEKFLSNSLAGTGGLDGAILTVEALEGITPETLEHFEMLSFLELQGGVVVITKSELAPPEKIEELKTELTALIKGSFLSKSTIVAVSSQKGEGIDELVSALDRTALRMKPRDPDAPARFAVDRVFKRAGFGTVVTGTLYQGTLRTEKNIQLLPDSRKGRIRRMHAYGKDQETVTAGQRVALNLSKIGMENLTRGKQVVAPGFFKETTSIDASITILSSSPHPLKHLDEFRIYIATSDVSGKAILLDSEQLEPGGKGFARLVLQSPVVTQPGDPFIIKSPAAMFTFGGGKVLEAHPSYHRRFDNSAIEDMKLKEQKDPAPFAEKILNDEPFSVFNLETLSTAITLDFEKTAALVKLLEKENKIRMLGPGRFASVYVMDKLEEKISDILSALLANRPRSLGFKADEIKINMPRMDDSLFRELLISLKKKERIIEKNGLISPADYLPAMDGIREECRRWIMKSIDTGGFEPPTRTNLEESEEFPEEITGRVIDYLIHSGSLTAINDDILFTEEKLSEARRVLGTHMHLAGPLKPATARELLNTSRKYVIPLLEYFDRTYFTVRNKIGRVLLKQNIILDTGGE